VIRDSIQDEFAHVDARTSDAKGTVTLVSWNPVEISGRSSTSRSLAVPSAEAAAVSVVFRVALAPDKLGLDSLKSEEVDEFTERMKSFVRLSSASPQGRAFVARIRAHSQRLLGSTLRTVSFSELKSLSAVNIYSEKAAVDFTIAAAAALFMVAVCVFIAIRSLPGGIRDRVTDDARIGNSFHAKSLPMNIASVSCIHQTMPQMNDPGEWMGLRGNGFTSGEGLMRP